MTGTARWVVCGRRHTALDGPSARTREPASPADAPDSKWHASTAAIWTIPCFLAVDPSLIGGSDHSRIRTRTLHAGFGRTSLLSDDPFFIVSLPPPGRLL